ncbi:HRDC domain-containing protein [candidate division CSSED10-310 bacterium]|uniref:HRDC domain-containing protein n=1 Tax=candidate division CSSED10-310 bacterium TaxID=2855610 RepID=A0ABV6Z366_UNCC1
MKDKEIHSMREHFFKGSGVPHLLLLVQYSVSDGPASSDQSKGAYKSLLSETDWPLFHTLRDWRNARAKGKGFPPYIIFDNMQLARISHGRPNSKEALLKIEGIGKKKADEYWEDIIRIISTTGDQSSTETKEPAQHDVTEKVP